MALPPLLHYPAVQTLGLGFYLARHAYQGIYHRVGPGSFCTRMQNIGVSLLALGVMSYGGFEIGYRVVSKLAADTSSWLKGTPSPYESKSYEEGVAKKWGASYLHLNGSDPRPKILWLASRSDANRALDPLLHYPGFDSVWERHGHRFETFGDFQYKQIETPQEMCDAVQSAVQMGDVKTVVIAAHATRSGLKIKEENQRWNPLQFLPTKGGWFTIINPLPAGCLDGISPEAKIYLFSCSAGSYFAPLNIAEWLAWTSGKTVYASSDWISAYTMAMHFPKLGVVEIDFCDPSDHVSKWDEECTNSKTRVFSPPTEWFGQSLMYSKMGVTTLAGYFTAYQWIQAGVTVFSRIAARLFRYQ